MKVHGNTVRKPRLLERFMRPFLAMRLIIACTLFGSMLLGLPIRVWAQTNPACFSIQINAKGSSGAAITVDATAGGVVIADGNTSRCALTIINETSNPMRCAPSTGKYALTVSSTVGAYIPPGAYPVFGRAAQEQWKCVRTGGTSASVTVLEDLP